MNMYDTYLGQMEVELEIPNNIVDSRITSGYKVSSFEELSEEELEYLNTEYSAEIIIQACLVAGVELDDIQPRN